ncbi:hypothetical protein KC723_03350 [Candidatus Kaiserbacteria bacterium]|nr:hypothetical protein [Candidatus Kaiserbacteria bacterium]
MKYNSKTLRRKIMLRVYYAYAISLITHPMAMRGIAFPIALAIFAKQVHVASVINNALATDLGRLPYFIWNAFARGEVVTIFAVGVMIFVALSVPWKLVRVPLGRALVAS